MIRQTAGSVLLLLVLALIVAGIPASAETLAGRVVGVTDGDTLTVLVEGNRQVKVRLAGIDAPERGQPFGQQSKQALSALAFGHEDRGTGSSLKRSLGIFPDGRSQN